MHTVDLPRLAPELSTSRLILRGHSIDDFDDCAAMWGDRQVTRFIGGEPSNREQSWSRLLRYIGHWAMLGFGSAMHPIAATSSSCWTHLAPIRCQCT